MGGNLNKTYSRNSVKQVLNKSSDIDDDPNTSFSNKFPYRFSQATNGSKTTKNSSTRLNTVNKFFNTKVENIIEEFPLNTTIDEKLKNLVKTKYSAEEAKAKKRSLLSMLNFALNCTPLILLANINICDEYNNSVEQ
jgi:hypothetical protein